MFTKPKWLEMKFNGARRDSSQGRTRSKEFREGVSVLVRCESSYWVGVCKYSGMYSIPYAIRVKGHLWENVFQLLKDQMGRTVDPMDLNYVGVIVDSSLDHVHNKTHWFIYDVAEDWPADNERPDLRYDWELIPQGVLLAVILKRPLCHMVNHLAGLKPSSGVTLKIF